MRSMILAAAAAAAVMFINIPAGHASEGPWCSSFNLGLGEVQNCSYRSLAHCTHDVIAGNRGTCFPNPRFGGDYNYGRGRRGYY